MKALKLRVRLVCSGFTCGGKFHINGNPKDVGVEVWFNHTIMFFLEELDNGEAEIYYRTDEASKIKIEEIIKDYEGKNKKI